MNNSASSRNSRQTNTMATTRTTTTTPATTRNTFPTTINGPKELKEYIKTIHELIESVRAETENDLKHPIAHVQNPTTASLGSRDFDWEMCRVTHTSFVRSATYLPQHSKLLQTEQQLTECLDQLETIRKMLVNNKQQKQSMINSIKKTCKIASIQTVEPNYRCGGYLEMEIEYQPETVRSLKAIIEQVKQNHRTVAKRLLEQAHQILLAIRLRYIPAYKSAAETTIGEIINHAEKCRAFFAQCRYNALIEFCATAWWMNTQKDPMDHSPYYVKVVFEGEPREFRSADPPFANNVAVSPIRVDVQNAITREIVFSEYLDQDFAQTIITEEVVNEFEANERAGSTQPTAAATALSNDDEDEDDGDYADQEEDEEENKVRIWGTCVATAWS